MQRSRLAVALTLTTVIGIPMLWVRMNGSTSLKAETPAARPTTQNQLRPGTSQSYTSFGNTSPQYLAPLSQNNGNPNGSNYSATNTNLLNSVKGSAPRNPPYRDSNVRPAQGYQSTDSMPPRQLPPLGEPALLPNDGAAQPLNHQPLSNQSSPNSSPRMAQGPNSAKPLNGQTSGPPSFGGDYSSQTQRTSGESAGPMIMPAGDEPKLLPPGGNATPQYRFADDQPRANTSMAQSPQGIEPAPSSIRQLPSPSSPTYLGMPAGQAGSSSMQTGQSPFGTSMPTVSGSSLISQPLRNKGVEGPQSPQLTIEKQAPAEVQVGKPAAMTIHIRNTGSTAANNVMVRDAVPEGMQFVKSSPSARPDNRGEMTWQLGTLAPGAESKITLEYMPHTEGELGSVATVSFNADAASRTKCVKPALAIEVNGPKQIHIGDKIKLTVRISNPGSGTASNIMLEEHVPAALTHENGSELELPLGSLKPGETKDLDLDLTSVHAGRVINSLTARADGGIRTEANWEFEIQAPALQLTVEGPQKRFLERPATYSLTLANPGTAAAKDVELVASLPKGMKFMKADNEGTYDASQHAVLWSLEALPAKERGTVTVTLLPIEPGEQVVKANCRAKNDLTDAKEITVAVEGVAAILFEVVDLADPIELNGETAYDIRIINQGSKEATNVQLSALMPPELKFLSAEGATRHRAENGRVIFEPLQRLPAKSETVYRIKAKGERAGDVRMKVQLMSDEIRQPITKEESTQVYSD